MLKALLRWIPPRLIPEVAYRVFATIPGACLVLKTATSDILASVRETNILNSIKERRTYLNIPILSFADSDSAFFRYFFCPESL